MNTCRSIEAGQERQGGLGRKCLTRAIGRATILPRMGNSVLGMMEISSLFVRVLVSTGIDLVSIQAVDNAGSVLPSAM